jgi:hypothetical protein
MFGLSLHGFKRGSGCFSVDSARSDEAVGWRLARAGGAGYGVLELVDCRA